MSNPSEVGHLAMPPNYLPKGKSFELGISRPQVVHCAAAPHWQGKYVTDDIHHQTHGLLRHKQQDLQVDAIDRLTEMTANPGAINPTQSLHAHLPCSDRSPVARPGYMLSARHQWLVQGSREAGLRQVTCTVRKRQLRLYGHVV